MDNSSSADVNFENFAQNPVGTNTCTYQLFIHKNELGIVKLDIALK